MNKFNMKEKFMIYVGISTFLKHTEHYLDEVKSGTIVHVCLDDGTELKLEKFIKE